MADSHSLLVRKRSGLRSTVTEIPARIHRAAELRAASIDAEARTVEVIWTTGARVLRGFFETFYEELSLDPKHVRMDELASGSAPLLDSHNAFDTDGQIGVVESARLENGRGVAMVRFVKNDERADRLWNKVTQGILRNVSVGYQVRKFEKVEGGDAQIPVFRAIDWEPREISMVPIGADRGAKVRSEPLELYPCEFVSRGEAAGDKERTPMKLKPAATITKPKTELRQVNPNEDGTCPEGFELGDDGMCHEVEGAGENAEHGTAGRHEAERTGALAERERGIAIRRAVRVAKLEDGFADELIQSGASLEKASAAIFNKLATEDEKTPTVQHVRVTADEAEKFQRGASDWLISKAGIADRIIAAAKQRGETVRVEPGEFRGLTFVDLARMCYERSSGKSTRGWDKMRVVGEALTYRGGGYQSTSEFAVLLENTMHKTLLAAYINTPDTWTRFCATGSVSDFRPHNRYRTGSFSRLEALTELGEFRNKPIPDATKELISATTKGNIISLSRQSIINDDLGAFSRVSTMIGRAAALSVEMDVYDTLALNAGLGPLMNDGNTLFHATHNNIGVGSVLSVEGLDGDRVVMAQQTDRPGNEILDLRPAVLVLAIGLGGQARVINGAEFDTDAIGANLTNLFMVPNRVRGLFRDIVDTPRLSGTRRYLFADPGQAPVLEVAFLDGAREPFLEVMDGWRIDGVEWKVRLDYGVAGVDFVGAVTNAGV